MFKVGCFLYKPTATIFSDMETRAALYERTYDKVVNIFSLSECSFLNRSYIKPLIYNYFDILRLYFTAIKLKHELVSVNKYLLIWSQIISFNVKPSLGFAVL